MRVEERENKSWREREGREKMREAIGGLRIKKMVFEEEDECCVVDLL